MKEAEKSEKPIQSFYTSKTSPINQIFSKSVWLKSKFKFFDINSVLIRTCVRIINNFFNELSFIELYNHFCTVGPQNLFFNAANGNIFDYYFSVSESLDILNELLMFQFDNDVEKIRSFLKNVYNVIDKKII